MSPDRLAKLVRLSTVKSGTGSPSQPAGGARQAVTAPLATAVRAVAKDVVLAPDPNDGLLPPEGTGQPPQPVLTTGVPPRRPAPAPAGRPAPQPSPSPQPAPSQASPGPAVSPAPGSSPSRSPVSQPATGIPFSTPAPAPLRAPVPLTGLPGQNAPGGGPMGRVPFYPLPALPVLRQPQAAPAMAQSSYGPTIASYSSQGPAGVETPIQTLANQITSATQAPESSAGCDCCLQVTALVATVTATSQSAITGIMAIARQR